jgi:peptidoglycan/LPS O-acetylase OafA/YrhL
VTEDRRTATGRFLLARFARLYPLYFVGLILSVSFIPGSVFFQKPLVALSCRTLTQSWFNIHGVTGDVIGPSWSISTEFGLYLFFIPLAAVISRLRYPLLTLVCLCVFAIVLMSVLVFAFPNYVSPVIAPLQFFGPRESAPPWQWLLYISPPIRAMEFFAGAIAAQLVMIELRAPSEKTAAASAVTIGCVGYCLAVIIFGPPWSIQNLFGALMPNFIFAPAIVTILIIVSCRDTALTRLLSSKPLMAAGEISYSVYLLQSLVFMAVSNSFLGTGKIGGVAKSIYIIAIVTALAYGVYHLFEAPMRRWIRSAAGSKRSAITDRAAT